MCGVRLMLMRYRWGWPRMFIYVGRVVCMGDSKVAQRAYDSGLGREMTKLVSWLVEGLRFSETMYV